MRDLLWGITRVTPESPLGQEVGKFIGYCHEAETVQQVKSSGTELPLYCSKPVYRGVVTQEMHLWTIGKHPPREDQNCSGVLGVLMTIVRQMRGTSD
ncbi:hypothetical protein DUI87_24376 [Hirundo rustica rustica]|uniref:Uncharacterized protein n=1 Tax=Hirundo rustica rustica TaxID=333673 RepID=A0A3M0JDV4_HIRRU|nr:hypothetical protein DUI87_24376 [Hirundo rustica rustica]